MQAETAQTDVSSERARDGMIFVRAGIFWMGSDHRCPEEKPAHRVSVEGFFIDETPVTNAQFAEFVAAIGHRTFAEFVPDQRDYAHTPARRPSEPFRPTDTVSTA